MRLLPNQTDEASFLNFGREAVSLLEMRDFPSLADRFGYALKVGRSPLVAIEGDFESCLAEFHASPNSLLKNLKVFKPGRDRERHV